MQPQQIAWIDVETTGLYPDEGRLLEVGYIITDLACVEIKRASSLVYCPPELLACLAPKVRAMHNASGLLADLAQAHPEKNSISAAQYHLAVGIRDYCDAPPILAGYRVSFDRAWMRRWMPAAETALSGYTLDVSCLRQVFAALQKKPTAMRPPAQHRAIDNCDAALSEMKQYAFMRTQ